MVARKDIEETIYKHGYNLAGAQVRSESDQITSDDTAGDLLFCVLNYSELKGVTDIVLHLTRGFHTNLQ